MNKANYIALTIISLVVVVAASLSYIAFSRAELAAANKNLENARIEISSLKNIGYDESVVESNGYQAVFLTDGQIYFGKLKDINERFYKLEDIYYLQSDDPTKSVNDPNNTNVSLAKLGSELHGPKDQMFIEHGQVLFWENLKDTGRVVQAIKGYKSN